MTDRIDQMRAKWADHMKSQPQLLADTQELLDIAVAMRDALQGLLEWREQPEVNSDATLAWVHGRRFTDEQMKRLHGYWDRAEAALARLEVKP